MNGPNPRLEFLDAARGWAVLGAVLCHALIAFGTWRMIDDLTVKALGNLLFRSCAPTFFLIFGMLLEIVYARQLNEGREGIPRRLAGRALLCYLGYLAGILAGLIGGHLLLEDVPLAMIGASEVAYSSVLRFYAIMLLVAIPLLLARRRLGLIVPALALAIPWLLDPILPLLPLPSADSASGVFIGRLIGHPQAGVGGSVLHNATIVFLGMLLGRVLVERRRIHPGSLHMGGPWVWTLILCGLLLTSLAALVIPPRDLAVGLLGSGMAYRAVHHPLYFALVVPTCLLLLMACEWLLRRTRLAAPGAILALGRHSLLAFTLGNAVLALLPPGFQTGSLPESLLYLGLFTVLFVVGIHRFACGRRKAAATAPPPSESSCTTPARP